MTDYLPEVYQHFQCRYPAVKEAFDALGAAEHDAGRGADMARVMVTLRLDPEQATLEEVRQLLGLAPEEVDPAFGVVNISPAEHLYTILVDETAAARIADAPQVEGVFGNPRIEGFGPPEEEG